MELAIAVGVSGIMKGMDGTAMHDRTRSPLTLQPNSASRVQGMPIERRGHIPPVHGCLISRLDALIRNELVARSSLPPC